MAVTYAVIRYRVIDARFVMSRSLTFGLIALAAAVVFGGIDWLFSTRLPNSRLETAAYAGAAILIGFSLDAARQRIGTLVDFMLFNPWYHVQQQAHGLEDVIRRSGSLREVYDPLITGVSRAFSLASAAIFERVEGGGFVRAAALGWSPGTLWHILPDDPLLMLLSKKARIVDLDAFPWREGDAPAAAARPAMMIPIRAGGAVPALLLYGAHDTGTGLAPEEERTIRSLCVAAAPVFGVAAARADSSALLEQRV